MNRQSSVNLMVKIALLSVISFVIMFIEFPLPLFPPFLKIDLSDIRGLRRFERRRKASFK